eukprot:1060276-Prymnesium_polylepis.1
MSSSHRARLASSRRTLSCSTARPPRRSPLYGSTRTRRAHSTCPSRVGSALPHPRARSARRPFGHPTCAPETA